MKSIKATSPLKFCILIVLVMLFVQQATNHIFDELGYSHLISKLAENSAGLLVVIVLARFVPEVKVSWFKFGASWVYLLPAAYIGINIDQIYNHSLIDWVLGLSSAALTGLLEEWLCRGLLFGLLLNKFKQNDVSSAPLKAVLVSSLLFGGAHLANILSQPALWQSIVAQVLYATLIGIGFCGAYWYGRSLLPLVAIHFAINALDFATSPVVEPIQSAATFTDYLPVILIFLPLAVQGVWLANKTRPDTVTAVEI